MCGMNLAFNRELIGAAMYFGLMGDGQPLGRYDDMWAGWCSKVLKSIFCPPLNTLTSVEWICRLMHRYHLQMKCPAKSVRLL